MDSCSCRFGLVSQCLTKLDYLGASAPESGLQTADGLLGQVEVVVHLIPAARVRRVNVVEAYGGHGLRAQGAFGAFQQRDPILSRPTEPETFHCRIDRALALEGVAKSLCLSPKSVCPNSYELVNLCGGHGGDDLTHPGRPTCSEDTLVRHLCEPVFVRRPEPPTPRLRRTGRPRTVRETPENVRICRHHGAQLHYRCVQKTGYVRWRCRRCEGEKVTRRKQKVRRILVDEAGGRCAVCGYDRCVVNLHFHHVDPTQKALRLSSHIGRSLTAFREEAKKCVLVCANCHGEIEAGLIASPPAGTRYRG